MRLIAMRLGGTDWSRVPLLTGALGCFAAAIWIIEATERGQILAGALIAIGSVLVGSLIVDWAQRDRFHFRERRREQDGDTPEDTPG